jgi:hypothetical protein
MYSAATVPCWSSRPQMRKVFHSPRSVTCGLVEAGVIHAVADELVRHRDALLRVGDVVADDDLDLLAVDAAGGVDVGRGLLRPVLQLGAEGGVRPGDRAADTDLDLGVGGTGEGQHGAESDAAQEQLLHLV